MANTYTQLYVHIIFAVKGTSPLRKHGFMVTDKTHIKPTKPHRGGRCIETHQTEQAPSPIGAAGE